MRVILDATRAVENAWFIQQREPGQRDSTVAEILLEMCAVLRRRDDVGQEGQPREHRRMARPARRRPRRESAEPRGRCSRGCTPTAGWPAATWKPWRSASRSRCRRTTSARASGRCYYLGNKLIDAGVPVVRPIGGHAVFLDAAAMLPHIPREEFPAQALAAALYVESGSARDGARRRCRRGATRTPGEPRTRRSSSCGSPFPRRVYTQAHMDVTAESVIAVYEKRDRVAGCASPTSRSTCASSRPGSSR